MVGSDMILTCNGVVRRFGALTAVDNVSFHVPRGQILGIGGPNGAGKTTLFDLITGLTTLSSGEIDFAGTPISGLSADQICKRGIARTFQLNAAFDNLTVFENVSVAAIFGRGSGSKLPFRMDRAAKTAAKDALDFVGLTYKSNLVVSSLPVLDRKLLMIAGALATSPKMLFLDEPVGGLNGAEIDIISDLVGRMRDAGITIVLIEHVMRFLLQLSERIIIMHNGRVIFEGLPHRLPENEEVVEIYLGRGTQARLKKHFEGRAAS